MISMFSSLHLVHPVSHLPSISLTHRMSLLFFSYAYVYQGRQEETRRQGQSPSWAISPHSTGDPCHHRSWRNATDRGVHHTSMGVSICWACYDPRSKPYQLNLKPPVIDLYRRELWVNGGAAHVAVVVIPSSRSELERVKWCLVCFLRSKKAIIEP